MGESVLLKATLAAVMAPAEVPAMAIRPRSMPYVVAWDRRKATAA